MYKSRESECNALVQHAPERCFFFALWITRAAFRGYSGGATAGKRGRLNDPQEVTFRLCAGDDDDDDSDDDVAHDVGDSERRDAFERPIGFRASETRPLVREGSVLPRSTDRVVLWTWGLFCDGDTKI